MLGGSDARCQPGLKDTRPRASAQNRISFRCQGVMHVPARVVLLYPDLRDHTMHVLRVSSEASVAANFGVLGETNPMKGGVTKQPHDGVLSVVPYLYLQNNTGKSLSSPPPPASPSVPLLRGPPRGPGTKKTPETGALGAKCRVKLQLCYFRKYLSIREVICQGPERGFRTRRSVCTRR